MEATMALGVTHPHGARKGKKIWKSRMVGWGKRNPRSFFDINKVKGSVSLVTQGGDEYANPGAVENLNENQII